jgi:hypothetical protein
MIQVKLRHKRCTSLHFALYPGLPNKRISYHVMRTLKQTFGESHTVVSR